MDLSGNIFFDNIDIYNAFGAYANQGFYQELIKTPQVTTYTKNWADENGTERDFNTKEFPSKTMELPFFMHSNNIKSLLDNYTSLKSFLRENINFYLRVSNLNRSFNVKYISMPIFNKYGVFKDADKVCISFTLTLIELNPLPYLSFDKSEITLVYPPDIPDSPIDFNEFDFEIIGNDLIMSGEDGFNDAEFLNGNNLKDIYGIYLDQNSYNELLRFADQKTDIGLVFQTRTLSLPLVLLAKNEEDFFNKWWSFTAFLLDKGYFNLDVKGLLKRFSLTYSDMPNIQKLSIFNDNLGNIGVKFTITLFDDFPTIDGGVNIYDGFFTINSGGDLIFTQSDEWDDEINFNLDSGDLILEIF